MDRLECKTHKSKDRCVVRVLGGISGAMKWDHVNNVGRFKVVCDEDGHKQTFVVSVYNNYGLALMQIIGEDVQIAYLRGEGEPVIGRRIQAYGKAKVKPFIHRATGKPMVITDVVSTDVSIF